MKMVIGMKLKKGLVLRKVAGQYIVIPTGKLSQIAPSMHLTASAAYIWRVMEEGEFTEDSLIQKAMTHFSGVTEAVVRQDIAAFLKLLEGNYMLEDGRPEPVCGEARISINDKVLKKATKKKRGKDHGAV